MIFLISLVELNDFTDPAAMFVVCEGDKKPKCFSSVTSIFTAYSSYPFLPIILSFDAILLSALVIMPGVSLFNNHTCVTMKREHFSLRDLLENMVLCFVIPSLLLHCVLVLEQAGLLVVFI